MSNTLRTSVNRRQFTLGAAVVAGAAAGGIALAPASAAPAAATARGRMVSARQPDSVCQDLHARIGGQLAELHATPGVSAAHLSHATKTCKCPHCGTRIGVSV